jgi:surface antigen
MLKLKNIKIHILLSFLITSSLGTLPAYAAGPAWGWITQSAMGQFTEADIEMLKTTGREALENLPDQSETEWSNPDTGHSGSITVSNTRQIDNMTCRNTLLKNNAKTIQGTMRYLLCKHTDGTWQVTSQR